MKLEFSGQIFQKYFYIKFHENLSSGAEFHTDGRADGQSDRHDEADGHVSQFITYNWELNDVIFTR